MEVRTRFAPSPTGMQHIGGFRTALFAWAFARHNNGKFILRIEDTDQERKVEGAISLIIEAFNWLGLDIDEGPSSSDLLAVGESLNIDLHLDGNKGPYIQSLRKDIYKKAAEKLIEKGFAYKSTLGGEELKRAIADGIAYNEEIKQGTPYAIRLKLPKEFNISTIDGVRGTLSWTNPPLKDPVILKSDGLPTYHLAVVVDDHEMDITHVMRGEEWIPTTPIHLYLYECLGYKQPIFCHLAPILGSNGKKLSKRDGAASINEFKEANYLPSALLNFVALIGWSPGDDTEIFSLSEFVSKFSLSGLSVSGGIFDRQKLDWMNGEYINNLNSSEFVEYASKFTNVKAENLELLEVDLKERIKKIDEIKPLLDFINNFHKHDFSTLVKKKIAKEELKRIVDNVKEVLEGLSELTEKDLEEKVKPLADKLEIKIGILFVTLRVAGTGSMTNLPLFKCLEALGKQEVLKRLDLAVSTY